MRLLTERFRDRDVDLLDGIKVHDERGWSQVLPDPDEPVVHIYAEGKTREVSDELAEELRKLVDEIMETAELEARVSS
jgi:mannose-1-phosphate guanylyltransferase/phosphomannomutase